jgi:hypothetical protein
MDGATIYNSPGIAGDASIMLLPSRTTCWDVHSWIFAPFVFFEVVQCSIVVHVSDTSSSSLAETPSHAKGDLKY